MDLAAFNTLLPDGRDELAIQAAQIVVGRGVQLALPIAASIPSAAANFRRYVILPSVPSIPSDDGFRGGCEHRFEIRVIPAV